MFRNVLEGILLVFGPDDRVAVEAEIPALDYFCKKTPPGETWILVGRLEPLDASLLWAQEGYGNVTVCVTTRRSPSELIRAEDHE